MLFYFTGEVRHQWHREQTIGKPEEQRSVAALTGGDSGTGKGRGVERPTGPSLSYAGRSADTLGIQHG